MRLINTSTLELKDFLDVQIPHYAILSHRWGSAEDEVSYKEYRKGLKTTTSGYHKIRAFCNLAQHRRLQWGWIDTCCIDKRSSAELSEAINSMFKWYRDAAVCYAYLADVDETRQWDSSNWWSRGWTLQELIAPSEVVFFDRYWQEVGTKSLLADLIETITTIPMEVLIDGRYRHFTVAQKMSWAAGRSTARVEDIAYSLLGIFNIHMPLLYGEGTKAFERLQIEIVQKFSDASIFAWTSEGRGAHLVLARNPIAFRKCGDLAPQYNGLVLSGRAWRPSRVTSWGVEFCADAHKLIPWKPFSIEDGLCRSLWAVTLSTAWDRRIRSLPCTLVLVRSGATPDSYKRLNCYFGSPEQCAAALAQHYEIKEMSEAKTFYLLFDSDFDR